MLQHHDTPDNNKATKFDFTEANYKKVNAIIANYPPNYKASAVIPVLDIAQQQNGGWISLAAMDKIGEILGMAPIRVYEVGTFYSMYNRSKVGKYYIQVCTCSHVSLCSVQCMFSSYCEQPCHVFNRCGAVRCSCVLALYVQVCGTTPCRLNGAENVLSALEKHLGIHMGQTTADGMFTLGEMECMGCCVNAPMIVVSDYSNGVEGYSYNYYEDLTPEDAVKIADTYKSGMLSSVLHYLPVVWLHGVSIFVSICSQILILAGFRLQIM